MAVPSKWISASPDDLASDVARSAIEIRLGVVCHYLPLAARQADEDVQHVHQLRVGCRRCGAALRTFRAFLPKKRRRRMGKWLRSIRQAAGPARDDDVLLEPLQATSDMGEDSLLNGIIHRVIAHRHESQRCLVAVFREARDADLTQQVAKAVRSIRWRGGGDGPRFREIAHAGMADAAARFFRAAAEDLEDAQRLHALRIVGKRLRYCMEIFAGAFPEAFRESLYPAVSEIQAHLGAINDHATAQSRFQRWIATLPPDPTAARLAEMIVHEHQTFEEARAKFLSWWNPSRAEELRAALREMTA